MAVPVCKSVSFQFFCYFRSSGGKKAHACIIIAHHHTQTHSSVSLCHSLWIQLKLLLLFGRYFRFGFQSTHTSLFQHTTNIWLFSSSYTRREGKREREYKQAVWAQKHARVSMYMYVCMFAHPMWLCQNKALKIVYILNVIRSLYQFFAPSSSSSSSTTVFQNFRRWFYFLVCRFSALSFKSHKLPNLYQIF